MLISTVLSIERVSVAGKAEGLVPDKPAALRRLAVLLSGGQATSADQIHEVLLERELLQSTGVGSGIAVPHGAIASLGGQVGALLICPRPIDFDAIDGEPVSILFGLIGPRGTPAAHLRILASVSRLLRQDSLREQLVTAKDGAHAFAMVASSLRGEQ